MRDINILITGCCGYIGSHTCVELLEENYNVIGIDNFSNSKKEALDEIRKITGKEIIFYQGDILNFSTLKTVFDENKIDAVIDFAAYKAVGDSVERPIDYYINNVCSVLMLTKTMQQYNVKTLIFSSTAAVYGQKNKMPITENDGVGITTNPYGTSKLFCEKILHDIYLSDKEWNICIFRYFNPVGAHKSGLIGENPSGVPSNLMPHIVNVAQHKEKKLIIYGDDYDTIDGTGVRDYIHVVDLAKAHISGIEKMLDQNIGYEVYNLGTGRGYSVLEMLKTFEKVNGVSISYEIGSRRQGDVASCFASPRKASKELGWEAQLGLDKMCRDAYHYAENMNKK